jgi:hypothetical protein
MHGRLREKLLGTWTLVSFVVLPDDDPGHSATPLGERPLGTIMYSPDGYVSAQLMRHPRSLSPDSGPGLDYFAYSGTFQVDENDMTVTHTLLVSLDPEWVGRTNVRAVELADDVLRLTSVAPGEFHGKESSLIITWRRPQVARD